MYRISKQFEFSASHQLTQVPENHPCHRLHGHNYVVTITLEAGDDELDKYGFVQDYRELAPIKQWIDTTLDHRHLNEVLHVPPTAEAIARIIFAHCRADGFELVAEVSVSETPKTTASYRP